MTQSQVLPFLIRNGALRLMAAAELAGCLEGAYHRRAPLKISTSWEHR